MQVTEDQLSQWSRPPSETENAKCENAVRQITDALRTRFGNDISVIRQGSHRNRTNVRLDSDIDFAVVHNSYFFPDISGLSPSDKLHYEAYHLPASYRFSQFKADIHSILQNTIGTNAVERKNRCIRVTGNSQRVNADVVPAYEHRCFSSFDVISAEGIAFDTDTAIRISSFPEQHYKNGVNKNDATSRAYKGVVRILKHVRNQLIENHSLGTEAMPSFFLESLVWNVPEGYFRQGTWRAIVESVVLKIWSDMRDVMSADKYAEVSDLQWLFRGQTKRTHKQAEDFMLRAWSYVKA
jgi:hypothetical protein